MIIDGTTVITVFASVSSVSYAFSGKTFQRSTDNAAHTTKKPITLSMLM
jgi:hypothetical protein